MWRHTLLWTFLCILQKSNQFFGLFRGLKSKKIFTEEFSRNLFLKKKWRIQFKTNCYLATLIMLRFIQNWKNKYIEIWFYFVLFIKSSFKKIIGSAKYSTRSPLLIEINSTRWYIGKEVQSVFTQPLHHGQDVTQGQFLSGI